MIPILLTDSQVVELVLKAHEELFKSTRSLFQKQCLAEAEDDVVEKKREVVWRAHSSTRHCPAVHAIPKPKDDPIPKDGHANKVLCVLMLTHHSQAVTA